MLVTLVCNGYFWLQNEALRGLGERTERPLTLMPGLVIQQIRICNLLAEELWVRRKQFIEP